MSRYYDPVTHRFVNADGYFQSGNNILDTNMNAYCGNNPIVNIDPNGNCYEDKETTAGTYIGTYWVVKTAVPGAPGYCNDCKCNNPNSIITATVKTYSKSDTFNFGLFTVDTYVSTYYAPIDSNNCINVTLPDSTVISQSRIGPVQYSSEANYSYIPYIQNLLGIALENTVTSYGCGATPEKAYSCWDYSCTSSNGLVASSGVQISMTHETAKAVAISTTIVAAVAVGVILAPSTGGTSLYTSLFIAGQLAGAY